MILRLTDHPEGVETTTGNHVVYDVERDEAHYGAARVDGRALVWELTEKPAGDWLTPLRPGRLPARRRGLPPHPSRARACASCCSGRIRIETQGARNEYGPFESWYETGPDPVHATASATEETAFVRVLVLPAEWAGKRTISYVDPSDEDRPKLQRARVYFEHRL